MVDPNLILIAVKCGIEVRCGARTQVGASTLTEEALERLVYTILQHYRDIDGSKK